MTKLLSIKCKHNLNTVADNKKYDKESLLQNLNCCRQQVISQFMVPMSKCLRDASICCEIIQKIKPDNTLTRLHVMWSG